MTCDACGTTNRDGRRFCKACGTALDAPCAACGSSNEADARFCGACGSSLDGTVGAPERVDRAPNAEPDDGDLVEEQRYVSVLFADLVGYTALTERTDAEDIRDLLTEYYDRARRIIERFGGVVDKFIGDAVMGVWGARTIREDDAQRAVRAALELVEMVEGLGRERDLDGLAVRAGVNSGRTVVGPGGNAKGLVVGDLVNVASRLQTLAAPGSVLVGSATREVTDAAIDYEDLGQRTVKGRSDPVHAFRAVRVAGAMVGRTDEAVRRPPFVGRHQELRLLKDALEAVEADGRARLVSLVGDAGIGKTRLAEEFHDHIDGYTRDIYWHWGRSPSHGEGVSFWALGEMIRRRAGITEGEDRGRSLTRLRTMLAEFVPDESDRRWIEPHLAGLLGLGEMPSGSRDELFAALRSFFHHVAARGPVVIVFEDVHWADGGLLEFIDELIERSTRWPILVVTLARAELLERRPDWGSQHRNSIGARLSPLSDGDMEELLRGYIPGVDDEVIAHIVSRVSGFPLYAVEIVRMLTVAGHLVVHGGRYSFEGDLDAVALPDTLQTVVGARLDRIRPEQRDVIGVASILGQTFTLEALAEVTGTDAGDLARILRSLIGLELLEIEDDPRSPETGQYRFVQGVIREVAYQRITKDGRRRGHLAAAEHFERFDDPELAGIVAAHYMGAYEATTSVSARTDLVDKAMRSLTEAARRAAALHSHRQAMILLDQAMDLAEDPRTVAEMRLTAALSAMGIGDVERGVSYLTEARTYYEAEGDLSGVRRAVAMQAALLNGNFAASAALEVIEEVFAEVETLDDAVTMALAAEAARSYLLTAQSEEAIRVADAVLRTAAELAPGLGDTRSDEAEWDGPMVDRPLRSIVLDSLITRATALIPAGRQLEAMAILRGVAVEAQKEIVHGGLDLAGRALNNLAYLLGLWSPREAFEVRGELLSLARRSGGLPIQLVITRAWDLVDDGRYAEAEAFLEEAEEFAHGEFAIRVVSTVRAALSLRTSPSLDAFERALEEGTWFAGQPDPQSKAWSLLHRARTHAEIGRWEEAFASAMSMDHEIDPEGLWVAALAAAWMGDADRTRAVAAVGGSPVPLFADLCEAIASGLEGGTERSARTFKRLIDVWEDQLLGVQVAAARAACAKVLGPDHPYGAEAAGEAHRWCEETGTESWRRTWAELAPAGTLDTAAG